VRYPAAENTQTPKAHGIGLRRELAAGAVYDPWHYCAKYDSHPQLPGYLTAALVRGRRSAGRQWR
jgi:hypothetical protein